MGQYYPREQKRGLLFEGQNAAAPFILSQPLWSIFFPSPQFAFFSIVAGDNFVSLQISQIHFDYMARRQLLLSWEHFIHQIWSTRSSQGLVKCLHLPECASRALPGGAVPCLGAAHPAPTPQCRTQHPSPGTCHVLTYTTSSSLGHLRGEDWPHVAGQRCKVTRLQSLSSQRTDPGESDSARWCRKASRSSHMCFQLPGVGPLWGCPWSCPLFLGFGQALSEADPEMRIHVHVIQPGEEVGSGRIQPLQASGGVSWGQLQERTTDRVAYESRNSLSLSWVPLNSVGKALLLASLAASDGLATLGAACQVHILSSLSSCLHVAFSSVSVSPLIRTLSTGFRAHMDNPG